MIEVMLEADHMSEAPTERCCFCRERTNTWYVPKDVAVCVHCAAEANHDDVPSKRQWIRNERIAEKGRAGSYRRPVTPLPYSDAVKEIA